MRADQIDATFGFLHTRSSEQVLEFFFELRGTGLGCATSLRSDEFDIHFPRRPTDFFVSIGCGPAKFGDEAGASKAQLSRELGEGLIPHINR